MAPYTYCAPYKNIETIRLCSFMRIHKCLDIQLLRFEKMVGSCSTIRDIRKVEWLSAFLRLRN